ncbi:MAG: radical SAM protein [Desulfovibrio sp.]
MAKREKPRPHLLVADKDGNIYDHPDLLMLCRRGGELTLPRPDEIMPLPPESEFFLLPGRHAVGFDDETGEIEVMEDLAVAAFASPAHTVTGVAAYAQDPDAPALPLLSYAAIGFAEDKFWVCAKQVDEDKRQVFSGIDPERIRAGAHNLLKKFPDNRLMRHLAGCALNYGCPAAKNLALGRFECPLPSARTCNARCVGCISLQPEDSGFPSPQNRIAFTPTVDEIVEVMLHHGTREKRPVFSFGQGCEGEPLTNWKLLAEATRTFRERGGTGTVNVNTNASLPEAMGPLAEAGVNSIRVSINSVRPEPYEAYYRPNGYAFADVLESIREAKKHGLFVSLNYLFFPGLNDTEEELDALSALINETRLDFIQLRNLNLDPQLALDLLGPYSPGPAMGLINFRKRLRKAHDWLKFGYFNPYLGE